MPYFTIDECKDITVKITNEDIDEADHYIAALMTRIGVSGMVSPAPYEVKRLAIAVAYRNRALLSSTRGRDGGDDVYMIKYRAYDSQVKYWEALVTPELLLGRTQRKTLAPCIPLARG